MVLFLSRTLVRDTFDVNRHRRVVYILILVSEQIGKTILINQEKFNRKLKKKKLIEKHSATISTKTPLNDRLSYGSPIYLRLRYLKALLFYFPDPGHSLHRHHRPLPQLGAKLLPRCGARALLPAGGNRVSHNNHSAAHVLSLLHRHCLHHP